MNNFGKLFVMLYADDTIIANTASSGLEKSLDNWECYCTKWKLGANGSKGKVDTQ